MASRLPAFVPKLLLVSVVALFATATLTYAAERKLAVAPVAATAQATPHPAVLVVPDLHRQAFVFAKGTLQDAGFAWRVAGAVKGYSANVVVSESPAAGTRVYDTGAPPVTLTLSRNGTYAQAGDPEDVAPYRATRLELADTAVATAPAPAAKPAAKPVVKPAATPAVKPAATPAVKPAATPAAKPSAKPAAKSAAKAAYPQSRPVAFVVAGARKEPLDEMPLPDRARALGRWLGAHPKPTNASVSRWLYQNEWIVTGAKLGWWRGAEALRILIDVDRRTDALWGIGSKSEATAVHALSEVEARTR